MLWWGKIRIRCPGDKSSHIFFWSFNFFVLVELLSDPFRSDSIAWARSNRKPSESYETKARLGAIFAQFGGFSAVVDGAPIPNSVRRSFSTSSLFPKIRSEKHPSLGVCWRLIQTAPKPPLLRTRIRFCLSVLVFPSLSESPCFFLVWVTVFSSFG